MQAPDLLQGGRHRGRVGCCMDLSSYLLPLGLPVRLSLAHVAE